MNPATKPKKIITGAGIRVQVRIEKVTTISNRLNPEDCMGSKSNNAAATTKPELAA